MSKLNFKLIKDNELLKEPFKAFLPKLKWQKKIRKLGTLEEVFYIGKYDGTNKEVTVKIRPSLEMVVYETYKYVNKDTAEQCDPKKTPAKNIVSHSASAEVKISQDFLDKMLEGIEINSLNEKKQCLEW